MKPKTVIRGYCQDDKRAVDMVMIYIQQCRKRQRISQKTLADYLGITQATFSRKEKSGDFSIKEMIQIVDFIKGDWEMITRYIKCI